MIEITKDQCTRMLVWDEYEDYAKEALVYAKFIGHDYPYNVITESGNASVYRHAKPLPEPNPMTPLDVMWWAGIRRVYRRVGSEVIWCVSSIISDITLEEREWNELIRKDGKTTLLYDEWKEFNFENCEIEEI